MVELWGSLSFFFAQIKAVLSVMLPFTFPLAVIGFLIYLALR